MAAHLILGYTPISPAFQAPSCVIKAKDPRLRRISVAYEGFLIPQGVPLPEDTQHTEALPVASIAGVISPSPYVPQIKEEEEVEREEEGFVDLSSATDDYEVFDLLTPSPNASEDMVPKSLLATRANTMAFEGHMPSLIVFYDDI